MPTVTRILITLDAIVAGEMVTDRDREVLVWLADWIEANSADIQALRDLGP
jgi:hypothetical protein